jgi:Ca2+/Na+ antiporter
MQSVIIRNFIPIYLSTKIGILFTSNSSIKVCQYVFLFYLFWLWVLVKYEMKRETKHAKRNETKWNETKFTETKRNETKV